MTKTDTGDSWILTDFFVYILHGIVACGVVVALSSCLFPLLARAGLDRQRPHFTGYEDILCLFVGSAVGWIGAHKAPTLVRTGRWLWLPLASLMLLGMAL